MTGALEGLRVLDVCRDMGSRMQGSVLREAGLPPHHIAGLLDG